ncbi:hypothetical protein HDV01_000292 [Terramyces sp. JEL0728]|nr:hypothetical protein HDV01_000292 [Terramyces sp. JEL0728]
MLSILSLFASVYAQSCSPTQQCPQDLTCITANGSTVGVCIDTNVKTLPGIGLPTGVVPHFPVPSNALPTNLPTNVATAPVPATQIGTQIVAQNTQSTAAAQATTQAATTTSDAEKAMAGLWVLLAALI